MQVDRLLHNYLFSALPNIHKKRLWSLADAVSSLLDNGTLTLTSLGRNMSGQALVKHKIKKVDRLLSNDKLLSEKYEIYKQLSANILKNLQEAIILIDWSGCCSQDRWILQASLAMNGRSIPLYKEIYPISKITNKHVHCEFLEKLYKIVPKKLKVIIVTDAGFQTPWFKDVRKLGWDYVGRIRNNVQLSLGDNLWRKTSYFNEKLKDTPVFIGKATLGKTKFLMETNVFGYKGKPKGRKRIKRKYYNEGHPDRDRKYRSANSDALVIVTSLSGNRKNARRVINIYKSRMQIEQNFRDLKNQRWGFGLRYSKTEKIERLDILLLIGFIATLILWLIAVIAEHNKLHYGFQANTKRNGRAISLFYLGWQIIKHGVNGLCVFSINKAYTLLVPYQQKIYNEI